MAAPSTTLSWWEPYATQSTVLQPFQQYGWVKQLWELDSHPIPLPSLYGREGYSFSGLAPPDGKVNSGSVVGIQPADSGLLTGYQVDEFTHIWFASWFVVCSHVYPRF